MHSPFGLYYQVCKTFKWTLHDVLWKVPRATWMLMLADQPGTVNTDDLIITKKGNTKDLDGLFGL
jgi:hypothetical protein